MLKTITTLLVFQLLGELTSFALKLPIPGPVVGMALLFFYLLLRPGEVVWMKDTGLELLRHLSLLFVPAGVGVMLYIDTVKREWLPIALSLVLSSALTIMVSAWTIRVVARTIARHRHLDAPPDEPA